MSKSKLSIKPIPKKYLPILERLDELYEEEHGGCDESTCSMQVAFEHGYTIHAIECFASSGAASDEFYKLLKKIPRKLLSKYSRHEAHMFCNEVSHAECPHCNAISWQVEYLTNSKGEIYCGNCAQYFKKGPANEQD